MVEINVMLICRDNKKAPLVAGNKINADELRRRIFLIELKYNEDRIIHENVGEAGIRFEDVWYKLVWFWASHRQNERVLASSEQQRE